MPCHEPKQPQGDAIAQQCTFGRIFMTSEVIVFVAMAVHQ